MVTALLWETGSACHPAWHPSSCAHILTPARFPLPLSPTMAGVEAEANTLASELDDAQQQIQRLSSALSACEGGRGGAAAAAERGVPAAGARQWRDMEAALAAANRQARELGERREELEERAREVEQRFEEQRAKREAAEGEAARLRAERDGLSDRLEDAMERARALEMYLKETESR